jgi:uncharacterized protein YcfJ
LSPADDVFGLGTNSRRRSNRLICRYKLGLARQLRHGMAWLNNTERNAIMKATTKIKLASIVLAAGLAGCASSPGYHARQGCAEPNYGGAVIGGLAGGLIGSQVGGGSGRTAATAIGAGTGAVIGSQMNCQ